MPTTDTPQAKATTGFSVIYRNFGHWDIYVDQRRAFRLRGTPGNWKAMDERARPYPVTEFKSFVLAMAFIADTLMHEELEANPESPGNNRPIIKALEQ